MVPCHSRKAERMMLRRSKSRHQAANEINRGNKKVESQMGTGKNKADNMYINRASLNLLLKLKPDEIHPSV